MARRQAHGDAVTDLELVGLGAAMEVYPAPWSFIGYVALIEKRWLPTHLPEELEDFCVQ